MDAGEVTLCWCSGPLYGAARCNCLMRGSVIRKGRWISAGGADMGPTPWPDMPYDDLGRYVYVRDRLASGDRLLPGQLHGALEWWGSRYGGDLGRLP